MLRPVSHPDLSKGVHPVHLALRCTLSARSISPDRAFLCPFPTNSWYAFVSARGFPRPILQISKIILARGIFFQNCVANSRWGKGPFLPGGRGGVVLCCGRGRGVLPACGRGLGLCPVSRSARPGLDHYRHRRRADGGPVSISTGSARPPIWPGAFSALFRYCYTGFLARLDLRPCRASLLPCGGLSLALWPVVPSRWRSWPVGLLWASGGLAWVGYGLRAGLRCLFGAKGVPGFIPLQSLLISARLPVWACLHLWPVVGCFLPCGALSRFMLGVGVVWCFSSSTGQKKNGPLWVVSPWVWVGVSSTGISLAGLAWILSRYAGRASPL